MGSAALTRRSMSESARSVPRAVEPKTLTLLTGPGRRAKVPDEYAERGRDAAGSERIQACR